MREIFGILYVVVGIIVLFKTISVSGMGNNVPVAETAEEPTSDSDEYVASTRL